MGEAGTRLCCDSWDQQGQGLAYLGWGLLVDGWLQDFGGSVASVPLLLYSNILLHLVNVAAGKPSQIERATG